MWHIGLIRMLAQLETRWGNLGKVENTEWEGRGKVYCHVQSSEGGSPLPVSIKAHVGWVRLNKH
jgi:hypothetical protein